MGNIEKTMKKINVKAEFDANIVSLSELKDKIETQVDETRNALKKYSYIKVNVKDKVKRLKKVMVEILNSYRTSLNDQETSDMNILNGKVESYLGFIQKLDNRLTSIRTGKTEYTDLSLFLAVNEMKRLHKKYSTM